jgi:hypothetical protein
MNPPPVPDTIAVSLSSLVQLAVEYWRLATWLKTTTASASAGPARHAVRKLEDFLKKHELDVQSLDGRPFDAGLAAKVIDTTEDPSLPAGQVMIIETLSPMVLYRDQVVRPAEIVTAQRSRG